MFLSKNGAKRRKFFDILACFDQFFDRKSVLFQDRYPLKDLPLSLLGGGGRGGGRPSMSPYLPVKATFWGLYSHFLHVDHSQHF